MLEVTYKTISLAFLFPSVSTENIEHKLNALGYIIYSLRYESLLRNNNFKHVMCFNPVSLMDEMNQWNLYLLT